jgi:hypothetical protein
VTSPVECTTNKTVHRISERFQRLAIWEGVKRLQWFFGNASCIPAESRRARQIDGKRESLSKGAII